MGEKVESGEAVELVKMSVLARRSATPASTIKHYIREGLLPGPVKQSRNMAYYDARMVHRLAMIKELQATRFLPLSRIKELLDGEPEVGNDLMAAHAISRALTRMESEETRTRSQLLAAGMPAAQLDWLIGTRLLTPDAAGEGTEQVFSGDDLAILQTLGAARRAGITVEMLPFEILQTYLQAVRNLVRAELAMFRKGVIPQAGENVEELTEIAAQLSERLVVLLRRKLLLPTLSELVSEEVAANRAEGR